MVEKHLVEEPAGPAPRKKDRWFDPGSMVTGLFFIGVAAVYLAGALSDDPLAGPEVLGPILLAGLGLVGIFRVLTRSRRH